jgi:hypothetical protein
MTVSNLATVNFINIFNYFIVMKRRDFMKIVGYTLGGGMVVGGLLGMIFKIDEFLRSNFKERSLQIGKKINEKLWTEGFEAIEKEAIYNILFIDENSPEELKKIHALSVIGLSISTGDNESEIISSEAYRYLIKGESYSPHSYLEMGGEKPENLSKPSELIETKEGECDDYTGLVATSSIYNEWPAYVLITTKHASTVFGETPEDKEDVIYRILRGENVVIGSSGLTNNPEYFESIQKWEEERILEGYKSKVKLLGVTPQIIGIISEDYRWIDPEFWETQKEIQKGDITLSKTIELKYINLGMKFLENKNMKLEISKDDIEEYIAHLENRWNTLYKSVEDGFKSYLSKFQEILKNPYEQEVAGEFLKECYQEIT